MKIRFEKENGLNKINVHSWIPKKTLAHNFNPILKILLGHQATRKCIEMYRGFLGFLALPGGGRVVFGTNPYAQIPNAPNVCTPQPTKP